MFESVEVGNAVDKETYHRELPALREALLAAQKELANAKFAVVIVLMGVDGAGKTETANRLLEWMDPRGIRTHALPDPSDEERERPPMWRFWRLLPPWGRISIFLDSWYTMPLENAFRRRADDQTGQQLNEIAEFERMLYHEGVLLLKFWLHLSMADQKKRLKELEADPVERWRVTKEDWKRSRHYDRFRTASEQVLQATSTPEAPWTLVEAADRHYRNLTVGQALLEPVRRRLSNGAASAMSAAPQPPSAAPVSAPRSLNLLDQLDLHRTLDEPIYQKKLTGKQGDLALLTRKLHRRKRSMVLVFEGPDAAGKGGAIRRLTAAMDARDYHVIAVSAPSGDEHTRPYLWRFWLQLPRLGRVAIFDRSWYGRVLVERIEGFCKEPDWQRAYSEINQFESQLTEFGIIVLKFWLAVSPQEQLRRFQNREETPYKQYKLTPEDWRNRAKWDAYQAAARDMIEKTSSTRAPWVLVEADNKEWARIQVLRSVVRRLKADL
jgi:polyphosphate:AMP phosphotransferase